MNKLLPAKAILLCLILGAPQAAWAAGDQPLADPVAWKAPDGVEKVSPCIPKMGEHWANKKDLPFGPWFNVFNGKLIAIEYAISIDDFVAGKEFNNATFRYEGRPLAIDHVDIGFQPHGHPGFMVPHYDLHFYLVSDAEDSAITCK
jgi:hypothetical protein